jgi:hypothetical protein
MRGGMPGPARVVEDRPCERDQVGIAGADNSFGLLEGGNIISPTAITGSRVAFFTARASGT